MCPQSEKKVSPWAMCRSLMDTPDEAVRNQNLRRMKSNDTRSAPRSNECLRRLKEEFGGRLVRVRGPAKVMTSLLFGLLALTADQLLRLIS
jgi:hypothetical protein